MLSLSNITWQTAVNWAVTIVPIWFVGMTLYQRIYAVRDEKAAKRAWFIAGLFEWPVMAFFWVALGMLARVAAEKGMLGCDASDIDPETGLPMLLRTILPVGILGLVMSAYFSAILSTADSCLMACSGNLVSDIIAPIFKLDSKNRSFLRYSQFATLILGGVSLILATAMTNVLELMLYSYSFMVSGLFVPVLGALFGKRKSPAAAISAMLLGGGTTIVLEISSVPLVLDLDANIFGIIASAVCYGIISRFGSTGNQAGSVGPSMIDPA
jgi:solute:Na+ symporter, SSS family